jgi:hypothetical protein
VNLEDSWGEWAKDKGLTVRTYNIVMREGFGDTIERFLTLTADQIREFRNAAPGMPEEVAELQKRLHRELYGLTDEQLRQALVDFAQREENQGIWVQQAIGIIVLHLNRPKGAS